MSWDSIALLAQRFFFFAITAAVAGSVLTLLILLLERVPAWRYSRMKLSWIKAALIMYLVPVGAGFVVLERRAILLEEIVWTSEFWSVSTYPMRKLYYLALGMWLAGLFVGVFFRILQYRKLRFILAGNIPIEDEMCLELIGEYKERYSLGNVSFYQNDLISYPVCTGSIQPKIILPMKKFTQKELHMVLTHEILHIKRCDLWFKKVCLLATFVHWWNPLVYILLRKLIQEEEFECDIMTCENSGDSFTAKEYGIYLAGIDGEEDDMVFVSALCKSKKDVIRRIESMVRVKKSHKKWTAFISGILLMMTSVIPSYAASEGVAKLNEKWIEENSAEIQEQPVDYMALETVSHISEDNNIEEIHMGPEGIAPFSSVITLDGTIKANTRALYTFKQLDVGDSIYINAKCSDSDISYRIGIRSSSGTLRYISGSGNLSHEFSITEAGSYCAFVENRSSTAMQVTGTALYNY